MKTVLVLGAGFVVKPMIDYFLSYNYSVTIATRTTSKADDIALTRHNIKVIEWTIDNLPLLDKMVETSDIVVSMLPPSLHIVVANVCVKRNKHMVTTSYLTPEILSFDKAAIERGIIILNEVGENPGIDIMDLKRVIDRVEREGGQVMEVISLGGGLPDFTCPTNPFGYKFSWSPQGVLAALKKQAAYLKKGKKITIPAKNIPHHHTKVDIYNHKLEVYPNRDSSLYQKYLGLDRNVSLFRGILRFPGWCNTLTYMKDIGLLDNRIQRNFTGITYGEFTNNLLSTNNKSNPMENVEENILRRLVWLGLFDKREIPTKCKTNEDVLINLMIAKMSYQANESDMVIIHNLIIAKFGGHLKKISSSFLAKGIPFRESAMAKTVSLPAAIVVKLVLENKIKSRGVKIPVLPEIYNSVLDELELLDYKFHKEIITIDNECCLLEKMSGA